MEAHDGSHDIPDVEDLRSALAQGNLVLFVGAGLSMGAELPGWPGLVRTLARWVGYKQFPAGDERITADHLITAAQHYENRHSRNKLSDHLRGRLDTTGKRPTAVHRLLTSWRVRSLRRIAPSRLRQFWRSEVQVWEPRPSLPYKALSLDFVRNAPMTVNQPAPAQSFNDVFPGLSIEPG